MITMNHAGRTAMSVAVVILCASTAFAQSGTTCEASGVIPLKDKEPAAKIQIDPPLPEPLASRGVVVIAYCAENMHIAPVFGAAALDVSPRVGHVHVTVDESPWLRADASGNPVILQGMAPGKHSVRIDLVDANHGVVDKATITFEVPEKGAAGASSPARKP